MKWTSPNKDRWTSPKPDNTHHSFLFNITVVRKVKNVKPAVTLTSEAALPVKCAMIHLSSYACNVC